MSETAHQVAAETADAVIIGAGVVGAAVAHRLAAIGLRVVVIERGQPAGEGTGASAANIHVQGLHMRRPGQGVALDPQRMLPLQVAARARWGAWEAELDRSVGFRPAGGLTVAETPAQVADLHLKHTWEAAAGLATEVLDADAARAALPLLGPSVLAATWCSLDAFADPHLTTPALLDAARDRGARIHLEHEVQALEQLGSTWTVTATGEGTRRWNTPVVINAAGPWMAPIAALAGVHLAMAPLAIQMHRVGPSAMALQHLVQHVGEGFSAKQDPTGSVILGGGWPAGPWTPGEPVVADDASTAGNRAQLVRLLPGLGNLPLVSVHPGALGATPDEMPVVGELAAAPGLFVVGGTYSFTFAPLWADVVASLVRGQAPPVDLTGLGADRLVVPALPPHSTTEGDARVDTR